MRRGVRRAVALGLALAGAGAVVSPALAARWDPKKQQWIVECGAVPAYESNKSTYGWEAWAGGANGNGTWYGGRSGDSYLVAEVDPASQEAGVYLWQPWHDSTPYGGGAVQGPFFFDMSVTASKSGVNVCNTNHRVPPTNPQPPVTPPRRLPPAPPGGIGGAATQPAR